MSIANTVTISFRQLSAIAVLALVAACGGGNSDAPASGVATGQNGGGTAANTSPNAFQSDVLQRVNSVRAQGITCGSDAMPAASALQWNDLIEGAAQGHSQYMKDQNVFSHTGQNGSSVGSRLTATGYTWRAVGENIAASYPDVAAVVQGWFNSEGHCRNLMNQSFTQVGVALVDGGASNTYGNYWTMVLAQPR